MDSDDDGIILPNSPLHAYLNDAGFNLSDIDSEFSDVKNKLHSTQTKVCVPSLMRIVAVLVNLWQYVVQVFFTLGEASWNALNDIDTLKFLNSIVESPCLEDNDRSFLKSLLEVRSASPKKHKSRYWAYALVIAVSGYVVSMYLAPSPLSIIEEVVVVVWSCSALSLVAIIGMRRCLVWHQERSICRLLDTMKDFQQKSKKCLQVIQETEVVARGFTLASRNIPIQRLEMNKILPSLDPNRQCPELRRSIFLWTRELFLFWKRMTLQVIESIPLEGELDICSLYLAFTRPEDVSQELFMRNEDELKEGTCNFSLSALKAMLYFMHVQHSEFLRRASLCLMPGARKSLLYNAVCVNRITEKAYAECQGQLCKLNSAYQFYKSCLLQEDEVTKRASKPAKTVPEELHMAVHSLELHLRAALKRIHAVESLAESAELGTKLQTLEPDIKSLLAEVKAELGSSGSCLEEVELLLEKEAGHAVPEESSIVLPPPLEKTGAPVVVISAEHSPVIEDEVFEAHLADKQEATAGEYDSDSDPGNQVSTAKQREASAVMFKELKSILVVKAKEHQEREKNALARLGVEGEHFDRLGFVVPENEDSNKDPLPDDSSLQKHKKVGVAQDDEMSSKDTTTTESFQSVEETLPSNPSEPFSKKYTCTSEMEGADYFSLPPTETRLMQLPLPLPNSIALMAVNKSRQFFPLQVNTFEDQVSGGSSEGEEEEDQCES